MKKILRGTVISKPDQKTAVLQVETMKKHAVYGKRIRFNSKYYVHDENGESQLNDQIEVQECRPISKTKRWQLVKVIKKAPDTN